MSRKDTIVMFVLMFCFALLNFHKLVPTGGEEINLFLLDKTTVQTLRWYIKDSENYIYIITIFCLLLAYVKNKYIRLAIIFHLVYQCFDFLMYWLNFRDNINGWYDYFFISLSVIYIIIHFFKKR